MDMWSFLQGLATVIGGITAIVAFAVSIANVVRRHLLTESPSGTAALLRHADPMADLLRRYSFVARSADTPIVVLIDNLDRCHASYVVEMLEGIQTLFKHGRASAESRLSSGSDPDPRFPLVVFMIAADRAWLCDSYLQVYDEFKSTVAEPGRPFGQVFLEKIFDFSLRIPEVPPALNAAFGCEIGDVRRRPEEQFAKCKGEEDVRKRLREIESECAGAAPPDHTSGNGEISHPPEAIPPVPEPRHGARIGAVRRLAQIELEAERRRQCNDTAATIDSVVRQLNPGPAVVRQLDTAYCVKRTSQLLSGHAFDDTRAGMRRLVLWTILDLRWPRLASHLAATPTDIEHLRAGTVPEGIGEELAAVFRLREAQELARTAHMAGLSAKTIAALTTPLPISVPDADGANEDAGEPEQEPTPA